MKLLPFKSLIWNAFVYLYSDSLNKWAECSFMDSSECTLRLSLSHLSRIENVLEADGSSEDSSDITCAGSCHEQATSCRGGNTKSREDGDLSVTTSHGSGQLKISLWTQLPLDRLPCSEPMDDMEPSTTSTFNQANQEQSQGPKTVSLSHCVRRIKNKVAHKRWRLGFLMIQIVRMLLPARLKTQTPTSLRVKTKTVRTATRLPCFLTRSKSEAENSNPTPILMFSQVIRPSFIPDMVRQRLEAHVRRKTSQRLWGFPNQVIKYVGDHVVLLSASNGRSVRNAVMNQLFKAEIGLCLKRRIEVTEKLQNLSKPSRKEMGVLICNKQLAEHPEILMRAATPSIVLDGMLEEVTSVKTRLKNKLRRKFLEVKLSRIPGKVLQSYHTAAYITRQHKTRPALTQQSSPCRLRHRVHLLRRKTLPFMSEKDLSHIELNLKLKHTENQQGKSTHYTLSLEKMVRIN